MSDNEPSYAYKVQCIFAFFPKLMILSLEIKPDQSVLCLLPIAILN